VRGASLFSGFQNLEAIPEEHQIMALLLFKWIRAAATDALPRLMTELVRCSKGRGGRVRTEVSLLTVRDSKGLVFALSDGFCASS